MKKTLALAIMLSSLLIQGSEDPLKRVSYKEAFDQSQIQEQFRQYLIDSGCAENLGFDNQQQAEQELQELPEENALLLENPPVNSEVKSAYEKACLKKLQSAKNWQLTRKARENLTYLVVTIVATYAVTKAIGSDTMGGSFSVYGGIMNSMYILKNIIESGYDFIQPPTHALEKFEKAFAKNQCFIPKKLWPVIIENFMTARQNEFSQRKSMDFIEFALGLTIYRPKPPLSINPAAGDQISNELKLRIDQFFTDYEGEKITKQTQMIKINVEKFINCLINFNENMPRYICLYGSGGIGKTHFVRALCKWIKELINDCVQFEELVVTTGDELEGNQQRPGAFLRVLRNQLLANKRGSVVFIDEATWLNNPGMNSTCKRVFNGDQSSLSTSYFGDDLDGTPIELKAPPMLIFVALNDDISDKNLKSRFDFVKHPKPKTEALIAHAIEFANNSKIIKNSNVVIDNAKIESWVKALTKANRNFRYIEANIEVCILEDDYEQEEEIVKEKEESKKDE
ncbi:MAG: ATP-binding protein [Candidatus Babeliales bacterium]|nr:ATP-binding protein [Candidatus Babeliales bacterium]